MGMFTKDPRPVVRCDPTKGAKQSFKDECDINTILRRHKEGAMISHVNANPGQYADVSEITDYRGMIERVRLADSYFSGLSSEVRSLFDNDPAELVEFISDPSNAEDLVELGLVKAIEEAITPPVAPVEPVEVPPVPLLEPVAPTDP